MTVLQDNEIDMLCRRAAGLSHVWPYPTPPISSVLDLQQQDLFRNLYYTGLRFTELTSRDNWELIDQDHYKVKTLKKSNPRVIPKTDMTQQFGVSLDIAGRLYPTCLYSTTAIWLQRAFHPLTPRIKGKKVTTHIFRHNFFKRLNKEGKTIEEIKIITGEIDSRNVESYIQSIIYLDT